MMPLPPPSLLLLLLLSARVPAADGVSSPSLTFRDTDPITGRQLECNRCPPGTYMRARCTATRKSECAPCPSGSFTELWNYIGKCLRCGVCGQNQEVKAACSATRDCQCACKQGYYLRKSYDMCVRHSECPSGHEVLTKGTAEEDTVCHVCPNGTFSDAVSAHHNCTAHRSCDAAGLQLLLRGSSWHDRVCMSCEERPSRDGASYLKEILPAFFIHHKMPVRRLRHIVHRLPSEDGKRQVGTSRLNLSDLHARINAWVASAAAKQIRQLPEVLKRSGAQSAGERLQNKLQRIDSHLTEQCPLATVA